MKIQTLLDHGYKIESGNIFTRRSHYSGKPVATGVFKLSLGEYTVYFTLYKYGERSVCFEDLKDDFELESAYSNRMRIDENLLPLN